MYYGYWLWLGFGLGLMLLLELIGLELGWGRKIALFMYICPFPSSTQNDKHQIGVGRVNGLMGGDLRFYYNVK